MKKSELVKVAKELDKLLFEESSIDMEVDQEQLEKNIMEAVVLLEDDDELTPETHKTLKTLIPKHLDVLEVYLSENQTLDVVFESFVKLGLIEKVAKTEVKEESSSLLSQIKEVDTLKELKIIVRTNDKFKALRGLLTKYKLMEPLKKDLLDMAKAQAEKVETPKKKEKGKEVISIPKDTPPKNNKGTYTDFMDETIVKGGLWEDILSTLKKEASIRKINAPTKSVLKAHIKYRISRNVKYLGKLKITEEGIV